MTKLAFLFPGQGSQSPGMGKALAEAHSCARQVFEEADQVLGFPLSLLCFEGPEDDLRLTENTQPAILTVSVAALAVLKEKGLEPAYVAGHSLGEYSALVAAGALRFADALALVRRRGRYMQEAVPDGVGAMAAILKLAPDALESIISEAAHGEVLGAANLNSPAQVVIAGHKGAVERAVALAKQARARAVPLPVSAPFHCPLMTPAQDRLRVDLDATDFADLRIPLVNNWRAAEVRIGADARRGLIEQVPNAVLWEPSIRYLAGRGITHFVEVGPGSVLTGLLRSIDPALNGYPFREPQDWDPIAALL